MNEKINTNNTKHSQHKHLHQPEVTYYIVCAGQYQTLITSSQQTITIQLKFLHKHKTKALMKISGLSVND